MLWSHTAWARMLSGDGQFIREWKVLPQLPAHTCPITCSYKGHTIVSRASELMKRCLFGALFAWLWKERLIISLRYKTKGQNYVSKEASALYREKIHVNFCRSFRWLFPREQVSEMGLSHLIFMAGHGDSPFLLSPSGYTWYAYS